MVKSVLLHLENNQHLSWSAEISLCLFHFFNLFIEESGEGSDLLKNPGRSEHRASLTHTDVVCEDAQGQSAELISRT